MGHSLILGMTMTGKTTLAKRMCHDYTAKGIHTIVLDPLHDPEWKAAYCTDDIEDFLNVFWKSKNCMVFIDESGDMVGRFPDDKLRETATRGRHWGHSVHYIAQRGTQINTTVRDQCGSLFLFQSSKKDGEIHAEEWCKDELRNCHMLRQGEFYYLKNRFSPVVKMHLF